MRVQVDIKRAPIVKGPGATQLLKVAVTLLDPRMTQLHGGTRVRFTLQPEGTSETSEISVTITKLMFVNDGGELCYHYEGVAPRGVKVWGHYSLSTPCVSFIEDAS